MLKWLAVQSLPGYAVFTNAQGYSRSLCTVDPVASKVIGKHNLGCVPQLPGNFKQQGDTFYINKITLKSVYFLQAMKASQMRKSPFSYLLSHFSQETCLFNRTSLNVADR